MTKAKSNLWVDDVVKPVLSYYGIEETEVVPFRRLQGKNPSLLL
jgi:hypothetical protein